jgi:hypothetical protein
MCTIFTGMVAGNNPALRIIRCPLEAEMKDVNPVANPLRGSFRLM